MPKHFYCCLALLLLCALLMLGGCSREEKDPNVRSVPVIMYHHLDSAGNGGTIISAANFERQIRAIAEAGYTAVSVQEMIDFVHRGGELPDKPVCITFDDGYESNFTLAAPILEKYGMKATVFCIGSSCGKDTYKDTENPIIPHFSMQQAHEMLDKGLFTLQSHTWDMHQSAQYETGAARSCICPLDGESDGDFAEALRADCEKQKEYFVSNGFPAPEALAYPGGIYSELAESILHGQCGILATFTTEEGGANILERGKPESLYLLYRYNLMDSISNESILEYLK